MNAWSTKKIVASMAVTAAVGLIGWSLWGSPSAQVSKAELHTEGSDGVEGAGSSPSIPTRTTQQILAPTPLVEHFKVDFRGAMTPFVETGGQLGEAVTSVTGQLEVAGIQRPGKTDWVAMRMTDPQIRMNEDAQALVGTPSKIRASLAQPWVVQVDDKGRVVDLRVSTRLPAGTQGVVATLAYALQFVPGDGPAQARWEVMENDVNGAYTASYDRGERGMVNKAWSLGESDGATNASAALGYHHHTNVNFEFDADGLTQLRYAQSGAVSINLGQGPSDPAPFSNTLTLHHVERVRADWPSTVDPEAMRGLQVAAAAAKPPLKEAPAELLVAASNLHPTQDSVARAAIRTKLTQAVREDTGLAAGLAKRLSLGVDNEVARRTVIEALAGAGTRSAERAIVGLVADANSSPNLRGRLLVAATLMTKPSAAYVTAMIELMLASPLGRRSDIAVALSGSANALSTENPAVAGEIVETLVTQAQPRLAAGHGHPDPPTMDERRAWLAALGNTASPNAWDSIASQLDDPLQPIRQAAAFALRFQDPTRVLPKLVERYAAERDPAVREALLMAARYVGPAALPLVKKALLTDVFESVRLEAAYTVSAWGLGASGMRQLLVEAIKHERSETVLETLKNYIQSGRVAAPFVNSQGDLGGDQ